MNDALQVVGLVVSPGGAVRAVVAAGGMRNSRQLDDLDGKVDVLSGRVDEQGRTLQSAIGALVKSP